MASLKVVLVGHPGSQRIVPASKHLIEKYLPKDRFSFEFLNHTGDVSLWGQMVANFISQLTDPLVVFGLDDYLIDEPMNCDVFDELVFALMSEPDAVSARLCQSRDQRTFVRPDGLLQVTKDSPYSCTAQWAIWKREKLIQLLKVTGDPWNFEITGTAILNHSNGYVIGSVAPALIYPDESCLSSKWAGVRVRGNSRENVKELVRLGHLNGGELC